MAMILLFLPQSFMMEVDDNLTCGVDTSTPSEEPLYSSMDLFKASLSM